MDQSLISTTFSPTTQLVRKQSLFTTQIDQDLVMFDETAGRYFGLNPVANKIWELLEKTIAYEQLLQSLIDLYDVSHQQCKKDVDVFLIKLVEHDLITI